VGGASLQANGRLFMTWLEFFLTRLALPFALAGVTFRDWLRLLDRNDFAVDPPYLLRAVSTTVGSLANSFGRWREERAYGPAVRAVRVQPPLFILGHWRSGTTHLHYLLGVDPRFAYPNTYQVSYPHTFLSTEAVAARPGAVFMPAKRPMDEVRMTFQVPNEDEFALCGMTPYSPYLGFVFPRRQEEYDPYLTFRGVSAAVIDQWRSALVYFLQKLTWKYGRPLVLKSPPHTCRIGLLLDLFPDAPFIHIRRNPYTVFQSTRHWLTAAGPWWRLQRPGPGDLEARVLRVYREMYDAFFEELGLIPEGHLTEVHFENLEADPVGQLEQIYQALGLPDFGAVEPAVREYVEGLAGYRKNVFLELPADLRQRIGRKWGRCFEAWGYPL
jgi:hypothetical protein